jgi:hypothetical protein
MRCENCEEELTEDQAHFAYDEPYCEECFDNLFIYCCRCDSVVSRSDIIHYSDDGDPYCTDCWDEDYDDDAPNNPNIYDEDRDLIIHLSRSWLQVNNKYRRLIVINERDDHLKEIRGKVGYTYRPLYVFGLIDREDYQISASRNILDEVKEYMLLHFTDVKVIEGIGTNRLGISLSLRETSRKEITSLIKEITSVEEPVMLR